MQRYSNRYEAGKVLAESLATYRTHQHVIVLALPRGGVPVGFEVAKALKVPLDVFIVRKLGVPGHSELAMGALAMGGITVFNDHVIADCHVSSDAIKAVLTQEQQELARRMIAYRGHEDFPLLQDKTVILVDDGVATGATMRAAIKAIKQLKAQMIVVAVPVADKQIVEELQMLVDDFICPMQPNGLYAVGAWYEDFSQTEDEEVYSLLKESRKFIVSHNGYHA